MAGSCFDISIKTGVKKGEVKKGGEKKAKKDREGSREKKTK